MPSPRCIRPLPSTYLQLNPTNKMPQCMLCSQCTRHSLEYKLITHHLVDGIVHITSPCLLRARCPPSLPPTSIKTSHIHQNLPHPSKPPASIKTHHSIHALLANLKLVRTGSWLVSSTAVALTSVLPNCSLTQMIRLSAAGLPTS